MTSITLESVSGVNKLNEIGDTLQLRVLDQNGNEYNNVDYISNNINIATVDQTGLVTAVGNLSCIITAVTNDGSKLKDTIVIHVASDEGIRLYSDGNDTNVGIGNNLKLSCIKFLRDGDFNFYNNVTYSVNDDSLAEIVEDKLVGKAVGSVFVKATDNLDRTKSSGITFEIVEQGDDYGASIKTTSKLSTFWHSRAKNLSVGTDEMLYVVKDNILYYNVTYSVDNTDCIEIIDSDVIRCKSPGTATITITDKADPSINTQLTINVVE